MTLTAPTGARMIVLRDSPIAGSATPTWPAKDPNEVLVFGMDFSARIEGAQTIVQVASPQSGVMPAGSVTIAAPQFSASRVWFGVTGGTDGMIALIPVKVELSDGEILIGEGRLPIVTLAGSASLPAFVGNFVTDPVTGLAITDPVTGQTIGAPQ
jgi:hypothetical protein